MTFNAAQAKETTRMKTRQEIKKAIEVLNKSRGRSARDADDMSVAIDVLRWALGDKRTVTDQWLNSLSAELKQEKVEAQ